MLSVAIIYFREFLEISLIVGMVVAVTKDIKGRFPYVIYGLIAGIACSGLFAYLLKYISDNIDDEIEDIFISIILFMNVFMISYTIILMQEYSKKISTNLKRITNDVQISKIPFYTISFIIACAICREGIEIILFTYGIIISSNLNITQIFLNGIIGSFCGIVCGILTYFSIIKLPIKYFFKITTILLILLAANLASQIPIHLESAGILNIFSTPLWDSSWLINEQSIIGKIMHSLIGYSDKPSAMQLIFYTGTIFILLITKTNINKLVKD